MHALDQLYYLTTRIEVSLKDGGTATGTGFFYGLHDVGNSSVPVLITNKHVIEGAKELRFALSQEDGQGGVVPNSKLWVTVQAPENNFVSHPDPSVDLVCLQVGGVANAMQASGKPVFFRTFSEAMIADLTKEDDFLPIENVIMIGYPNGLWDDYNNQPIIRRGITATHPLKDYRGRKEFMIDAACFPGSSGSPILIYEWGVHTPRTGAPRAGARISLLGVLFAGPVYTAEGTIEVIDVPTRQVPIARSEIPLNLGIAIKASEILRFKEVIPKPVEAQQDGAGNA